MTMLLELVGVVLLILLNAFFVAGEYALVTVRRTRMKELADEGSRTARSVVKITSDPPHFIAAMQLGVTLTSLAIGALGERVLSDFFAQWLATILAVLLAFLIITFLHVVVGELVPKGIALSYSERIALGVSTPVRLFFFVFKPLIWVLQRSSELAQRAIGIDPTFSEGAAHSEAELKMLLEVSTEHGEIETDEREMLYKVFDFAEKEVADVMVPRPDVAGLAIDLAPDEAMAAMLEAPYTRYPVYRETLDDIDGILHVRDMVALADLLRAPYVVPETKDLGALLAEFRRTSQHMAVVVDEYGATAGIVTLEDLLEEIVGEIEDEFDLPNESIERVSDTIIRIDGSFTIDDFNEEFGTGLESEDFHTVGGFVFGHLGRAAEVGDEVAEDQLRFCVLMTSGSRIQKIEVEFLPAPVGADDTPEAA